MSDRIYLVDFLRGLAIINMIIYHTLYDLKYVFDLNMPFFSTSKWYFYQQYICISFIFLSGFSSNFSKNILKNSVRLSVLAFIISVVTISFSNELAIYFGVIHFLAVCMFFVIVLNKIYKFETAYAHTVFFVLAFCIFCYLKSKYFLNSNIYFFADSFISKLPFSFVFGFPDDDFYSADYFPIIPWIFLFLSGYFVGKYYISEVKKKKIFAKSDKKRRDFLKSPISKIFSFIVYISRHSLMIYVLHQVVIYAVLYIIFEVL